MTPTDAPVTLIVWNGAQRHVLAVPRGANLRRVLLAHNLTPYAPLARTLNCGGRGLCATCGVWLEDGAPAPAHWHDGLAGRFGYPRLSCQVTIDADMTVRLLPGKRFWGHADPARRTPPRPR